MTTQLPVEQGRGKCPGGRGGEGRRTQGRRKDRGEGERQVVKQTFRKHKRKRREEEDRRAEAEGHILEGSINHGSAFTVVLNIKLNIVFMSHEKRSRKKVNRSRNTQRRLPRSIIHSKIKIKDNRHTRCQLDSQADRYIDSLSDKMRGRINDI